MLKYFVSCTDFHFQIFVKCGTIHSWRILFYYELVSHGQDSFPTAVKWIKMIISEIVSKKYSKHNHFSFHFDLMSVFYFIISFICNKNQLCFATCAKETAYVRHVSSIHNQWLLITHSEIIPNNLAPVILIELKFIAHFCIRFQSCIEQKISS